MEKCSWEAEEILANDEFELLFKDEHAEKNIERMDLASSQCDVIPSDMYNTILPVTVIKGTAQNGTICNSYDELPRCQGTCKPDAEGEQWKCADVPVDGESCSPLPVFDRCADDSVCLEISAGNWVCQKTLDDGNECYTASQCQSSLCIEELCSPAQLCN